MSSLVKTVIDPGGFLTGQPSMQGAMDPGGAIFKAATGSDIAQKIADPAGILKPPEPPAIPNIPDLSGSVLSGAEVDQAAEAAARAEQEAQRKRRGRRSTILTGGLGLQSAAPTRKPTILGTVS